MATYRLTIRADTNDADYVTETTDIKEKDLPKYMLLINKVVAAFKSCKKKSGHNWPTSDYSSENIHEIYKDVLTEEEIISFSDLCPHGEYGIHTIERIELCEIGDIKRLF